MKKLFPVIALIVAALLLCSCGGKSEAELRTEIQAAVSTQAAAEFQADMRVITRQAYYKGWFDRCIVDAENLDGSQMSTADAIVVCTKILTASVDVRIYENRETRFPPLPDVPLGVDPAETPTPAAEGPQGFYAGEYENQ